MDSAYPQILLKNVLPLSPFNCRMDKPLRRGDLGRPGTIPASSRPSSISSKQLIAAFKDVSGGGGLILTTKAGDLARRLGLAPSLGEIEELKAVAGEYCDISTFATFCKGVAHCNDSPKLLAELFGCYDPSCTGKVPLRVVRNILQNCGEVLTNDEVNAVLEASTEEVDYKAFCERLLLER
ncbi:Myosin light chain TgMLC1, related [Eimeria acervulina]|uniref:Myosin light chain TgMLC1, related n=1 Tax=Eimeria acervulina TaxID=5801 RepID=U6GI95_EIMAC|nr:Myosin light chain TgMLC1, related [Eimeria acervulina]CDI78304.1 Myosin light chain TgMLC1, related [Eimeria acervulina]